MGDQSDFRTPDEDDWDRPWDDAEAPPSKKALQEIAHDRGRICKKRGCVVCAPLVEQRRLKKKERKAEAQARLHAKGQPCSRNSCTVEVCVKAREAAASSTPKDTTNATSAEKSAGVAQADPETMRHQQAERHRVGLPCRLEHCGVPACVHGFANERTRRHRARRPCRAAACDNPVCVAARSKN